MSFSEYTVSRGASADVDCEQHRANGSNADADTARGALMSRQNGGTEPRDTIGAPNTPRSGPKHWMDSRLMS